MGWMSPKQLNDDPKRWLDVPHHLHESIRKLMERIFPDFEQKLIDDKVHCLKCEGDEAFDVLVGATLKPATVTGYIGDEGDVELYHTVHR